MPINPNSKGGDINKNPLAGLNKNAGILCSQSPVHSFAASRDEYPSDITEP